MLRSANSLIGTSTTSRTCRLGQVPKRWQVKIAVTLLAVVSCQGIGPASCRAQEQPAVAADLLIEEQEEKAEEVDDVVKVDVAIAEAVPNEVVDIQVLAVQDARLAWLMRYLIVERALIEQACQLSDQEQEKLAGIGTKWVTAELEKLDDPKPDLEDGNILVRGIARFLGGNVAGRPARQKQPHEQVVVVLERLNEELRKILTGPQLKAYEQAVNERNAFRTSAQADLVIGLIDSHVFLSETQIEQLHPLLMEGLDQKQLYWQFYLQNNEYFPSISAASLSQVLSPKQLKVIKALQRIDYDNIQYELQMIQHQPPIVIQP